MSSELSPLPKTRGSKLEETIKAQLHLDLEANPQFTIQELFYLPDREYKSQDNKAVRNRHIYLKNLKTKDPQHYWLLYSQAHKEALSGSYRDTVEEESDEEPPPQTPAAQSSRERRRKTTPTTKIASPPPLSNSKKNKNMSAVPSKKLDSASPAPAPLASFAYNTMFEKLEDAEASGMFSLIILVVPLLFLSFSHAPYCLHSR
jgi:hypothetical protein